VQSLLQWKSISITYTACVLEAVVIEPAMRIPDIVVCDLPGCTIFFRIISQMKRFLKKRVLNMKCVLRFSLELFFETFLILRRTDRHMIERMYRSSLKVPVLSVRFLKRNFPAYCLKNSQILNFLKIRPMGAELFHADGWTDRQAERRRS
jgi:hypothetical protein